MTDHEKKDAGQPKKPRVVLPSPVDNPDPELTAEVQRLMQEQERKGSVSRHREFACAIIIDIFGRFLLQQRDDVPGILHPGKVALFGGHREGGETYLQCVVREIHEEMSYFVPPARFEHLLSYDVADFDVDGGAVHAEFFVARDVPVDALVITEGSLLIVKPDEVVAWAPKLVPSTRFALKEFLNKSKAGNF